MQTNLTDGPAPDPIAPVTAKHPAFRDFINRATGEVVRAFHIGRTDRRLAHGFVTLYPPDKPVEDPNLIQLPIGEASALNIEPEQMLIQHEDGSRSVMPVREFHKDHERDGAPVVSTTEPSETETPQNA